MKLPIKCFLYCFNSMGEDLNNSSLPLDAKDSVKKEKMKKNEKEEEEEGKKEMRKRRKGGAEEWNMRL